MDFAKKILNKYGWKDGDGLGKNNDGISKPLRANLKFDSAGLGSDQAASDFNNHWWERVFNEAASNVDVKTKSDGVCMDLKNSNKTVEISTKGYSIQKLSSMKNKSKFGGYDNFLQSETLTKAGHIIENPDKIIMDDINVPKCKQLTDDELFKACGGRTAHKGARHGLKLSGKLSRLELQEKEFLSKIAKATQSQQNEIYKANKVDLANSQSEFKKEKGDKSLSNADLKKKIKVKKRDRCCKNDLEIAEIEAGNLEVPKKKKKLQQNADICKNDSVDTEKLIRTEELNNTKKKKKL